MSFKEIKELRQSGKLEDALDKANQALKADPENIWNKRAAAWVHYDYIKLNASSGTVDQFLDYLQNLNSLNLPEDEKMVFDNTAFQIGKVIFALENGEQTDLNKVNEIFKTIKNFHFTRSAKSYSFLLKAFHKVYKNHIKFLYFVDWWGLENLLPEDFLPEEYNGRSLMSLAERAYNSYAKQLLATDTNDGQPESVNEQQLEKIREFLPKISVLIKEHPEYQYPPFYKAKLLLLLGNEENALSAFIPFARQKKNDFWVWGLMANIFPEEDERQFSCYCKALSLKTSEEFLVKIRQKFAGILIKKQLFAEAKTEIEKVVKTKKGKGWKVSPLVNQWIESTWYKETTSLSNNKKLYDKHKERAEEILFADIPEEVIVVEFINRDKKFLNFVKDQNKHGYFRYAGFIKNPSIGDVLRVRFRGEGKNGFYKILTSRPAKEDDACAALRAFSGNFKLLSPQNFGFVEDIFMDSVIVKRHKLEDAVEISGKALLSYNKKKKKWGWKAFQIN